MSALRVFLVGTGRLGCSLAVAMLAAPEVSVAGAAFHSEAGRSRAERWMPGVPLWPISAADRLDADLVLLCVRDDVIASVARSLKPQMKADQAVAHTSGLLSADVLRALVLPSAVGSFHPLQSFADPSRASGLIAECTIACEGDAAAVQICVALADALGATHQILKGSDKAAYHAAAVIGSNYLVVLTELSARLAQVAGIDEPDAVRMLAPLQHGALANLAGLGVAPALTGPFARGDVDTVRAHLDVIDAHHPELRAVYVLLGRIALQLACRQGCDAAKLAAIAALLA